VLSQTPDGRWVDRSLPPPFSLKDLRKAIPKHCFKKDTKRSFAYLFRDVAIVVGLAWGALWANHWAVWTAYAFVQGTMFWALFCVGHDCGHQSFSASKRINDVVGNIVHSAILVPYHPWRISHRKHHSNHGHVENDESWHPLSKSIYDGLDGQAQIGRFKFPIPLFAYPIYLIKGVPGKEGSHFDPNNKRLFQEGEKRDVIESTVCFFGAVGAIAACVAKFGLATVAKVYFAPYLCYILWLDAVTYLHHHGADDDERLPWYRGDEWDYLRGGLTTLDRDYGIFNHIHHDIGTHILHHLFHGMPHYNLVEATEAVKPVFGDYYREPPPCPGPYVTGPKGRRYSLGLPFHLWKPLVKSFKEDHWVPDQGDGPLFYQAGGEEVGAPRAEAR